jgi:hypothetical protein
MAHRRKEPGFSFRFGQRVRVLPPHPEAGATGLVVNAYLFPGGREIVFVTVPGGVGRYEARLLKPETTSRPTQPPTHRSQRVQDSIRPHRNLAVLADLLDRLRRDRRDNPPRGP